MPGSRDGGDAWNVHGDDAWNPDDYDGDHSYVYEYGADLLDLLAPEAGERVLDVGCGTGHLAAAIAATGAEAVGVDASGEMLAGARASHPPAGSDAVPAFVRADARRLGFADAFDAALSNAALHWIPEEDQDAVLSSVGGALRPGGRFVAEMGASGNVGAIVGAVHAALRSRGYATTHPWYFPTLGEYATRLEASGFEVRFARAFDRPTALEGGEDGLANWLGVFGGGLLGNVPDEERAAVIESVEDRLRSALYRGGAWTADYRRLRFVAVLDDTG